MTVVVCIQSNNNAINKITGKIWAKEIEQSKMLRTILNIAYATQIGLLFFFLLLLALHYRRRSTVVAVDFDCFFLPWIKVMRSLFIWHEWMACNCCCSDNSHLTVKRCSCQLGSVAQHSFASGVQSALCKFSRMECAHISCLQGDALCVPCNRSPTHHQCRTSYLFLPRARSLSPFLSSSPASDDHMAHTDTVTLFVYSKQRLLHALTKAWIMNTAALHHARHLSLWFVRNITKYHQSIMNIWHELIVLFLFNTRRWKIMSSATIHR